jgi:hypothetical protein
METLDALRMLCERTCGHELGKQILSEEHTGSMLYHQELDAFDKAMQKFQADADQTATDLQKYLDYYGKHHVKISVEACLLCSDE